LIDFDNSIIDRCTLQQYDGQSVWKRDEAESLKAKLLRYLFGNNRVARRMLVRFLADLKRTHTDNIMSGKATSARPLILIIGGGAIGAGIAALYEDSEVDLVGTDIYASPNTSFIADGHSIPLKDASIDAVWIQAVLEHVLDPVQVVAEIHRVLKPNGLVFADTPFMQQVHEGPYDFTRFTLSGHRWLFRHFSLIDAGMSGGPGSAALWTVRYFVRSVVKSDKIGTAVQMLCFWLRFADFLPTGRPGADASSAVYFYGRRATVSIKPRDIVEFYRTQIGRANPR
jgi:SAM-dependent methyltransferase